MYMKTKQTKDGGLMFKLLSYVLKICYFLLDFKLCRPDNGSNPFLDLYERKPFF